MGLSSLDYWRLVDHLTVVDAAILITGNDPSGFYYDDEGERLKSTHYEGFEPAFVALRNAVLSDKIKATVVCRARDEVEVCDDYFVMGERIPRRSVLDADGDEFTVRFDTFISIHEGTALFSNRKLSGIGRPKTMYVLREPSWMETTIAVVDLKEWLKERGVFPAFFFPQGVAEGFRDKAHPRYSPKLACAVAAWEAIKSPRRTKSVKGTIAEWVQGNGVNYGLADEGGIVPAAAVEEVSKVANWNTKGGAVETGTPSENLPDPIQNFDRVADDTYPEIPF